jgi:hypothetical protein
MQTTLKSKVSEIFTKYHFSREDAAFISDVLGEIDNRQDEKFQVSKELFLTQKDKTDIVDRIEGIKTEFTGTLYKTIFTVGIIQLLPIIGSVLAIINYMHK